MKTRTKIQRSMKIIPMLTDFGVGLPYGIKFRQRTQKLKSERTRLLKNENQFELTCKWLSGIGKTEVINTRDSSYYLKHVAENRIGIGHISNGTLIAAAIYCGFRFKPAGNYPNLFFNMSPESIQQKYQESLLYEKYPKEIFGLVH